MTAGAQISLFGHEEPACDETFRRVERIDLEAGAWLELARGWLIGDTSLFESLRVGVKWKAESRTVATVSLGAARTFLLRRKGGGPSQSWSLGGGDLGVMGGSAQRTYEHAIPKVVLAAPRIALMYRPSWEHP